jgi:hypothetical protein
MQKAHFCEWASFVKAVMRASILLYVPADLAPMSTQITSVVVVWSIPTAVKFLTDTGLHKFVPRASKFPSQKLVDTSSISWRHACLSRLHCSFDRPADPGLQITHTHSPGESEGNLWLNLASR